MSAPARLRAGESPQGRHSTSLDEPFGDDDLAWTAVEVGDGGDEVRVTPRVGAAALQRRLDTAVGVRGWSVSYTPMPGDAVACHLVIDGVTKGVVAAPALVGGAAVTAAVAFAEAAARFGAVPPWPPEASAWVACDPATGEPLHVPVAPSHGASGDAPAPGPGSVTDRAAATTVAAASAPASVAITPAKPDGQQMIDRLIERLKEQGQGLVAARILVRHGGYGKDPQAARELYAELRELLLAGAGDAEPVRPQAPVGERADA